MSEQQMANYTLTIEADSGYQSTTEGRCTAAQYGQAMAALHGVITSPRQPLTDEQPVSITDELPKGFVPLQKENGRLVYAACMDPNASHYKWLMWRHPDGQWVSKRKLEDWEVMQVEDQEHYGIVQEVAHGIKGKA